MAERVVDVYIGVGSNIEPEANIAQALELLRQRMPILGVSTFYRTRPLGRPEQPTFLNGAVHVQTGLVPRVLKFDMLRDIETALGRERTEDAYAARRIDLDILIYGDLTVDEPHLTIPDTDIYERAFVSMPLLELAPKLVLPDTGRPLSEVVRDQHPEQLEPALGFTQKMKSRYDE